MDPIRGTRRPTGVDRTDRPEKMNALDQALRDEFTDVLTDLRHQPTLLIILHHLGVFVAEPHCRIA